MITSELQSEGKDVAGLREPTLAQLEAEIAELRFWLRTAREEEQRLEAQLAPLRQKHQAR